MGQRRQFFVFLIFIEPSQVYLGSNLWVLCNSLSTRGFTDLTDVTLADEDTNSILTDNANKTIQGNVAWWVNFY